MKFKLFLILQTVFLGIVCMFVIPSLRPAMVADRGVGRRNTTSFGNAGDRAPGEALEGVGLHLELVWGGF